jgi:hypothetical protein
VGHECQFEWDSRDSACSTDFSEYSERGGPISDGSNDEYEHIHAAPVVREERKGKVVLHMLDGKIKRVAELPYADVRKYLTLELGREKVKRERGWSRLSSRATGTTVSSSDSASVRSKRVGRSR